MTRFAAFFYGGLFAAGVLTCVGAAPARADGCPGNPDAIGTSRVIAIKYGDYTRLGRLQYPQTLPLADHEVVLTFDDGPVRLLSDKALDILNAQCVKVTYFLVGEMAHYYPDVVRREYASGDVIGTHSMHHPLPFNRLSDAQVQQEIDQGIASVGEALGDPKEEAPFFRIPGFGRNKIVEDELAKRKLIVFSTDVVADDWFRHITPAQIVHRAMSRLERRGRGILLLHDIHPATVLALPELLKQLKLHGFHIVQVVPAGPGRPETPPEAVVAAAPPESAVATAMPDALGIDRKPGAPDWPAPHATGAGAGVGLAAPDARDFSIKEAVDMSFAGGAGAPWPLSANVPLPGPATQLPAPSLGDIGVGLRGEKLVGFEPRRQLRRYAHAVPAHMRSIRLRPRHPVRVRPDAEGQHAETRFGFKALASLFTPTRAR